MKLLTINVHAWQEHNQLEKINELARVIHMNRYDAIALQEASQHREVDIVYDSIRKDNYALLLQQALAKLGSSDFNLFWEATHYGYDIYEEGLALLVRHPVVNYDSFYITESSSLDFWKSRKIVGITIQLNKQMISLYSCHLGWWEDKEESYTRQVDNLLKKAEKHEKFLLLGDFNAASNKKNEGYDYLLSKGLYDTHVLAHEKSGEFTIQGDIAGWDGNKAGLKIDYIFANWQAGVRHSHIIFDGNNEPIISDHYGIELELSI
ncbi:endonuclease/exonuclease/phosphatase family protein [Lederbergia lenta]|uniref:Endonuclease/exonuclease/phosphatase family protein n=1 Tax=Lederbergia lenta TaxID=1467 RepID=A0A2X4WD48_LEDLE|nr:endonuclease/exonuclease/phosphatase family protein [Lederbergia lenta]MCM3110359.1 endonuclease/exonuclease/phosphatase family protein [Lederbergia lenta]MEC2324073.1 endonuclease/exonuclease/phosphatase family protein [Lederbergia lenta]SQI60659.1 endonuclease/exonuclease/phosphatase family protein [Lederbergia lenta]